MSSEPNQQANLSGSVELGHRVTKRVAEIWGHHRKLALLSALTICGLLARVYALGSNPPAVFTDELFPFVRTANLIRLSGPFYTPSALNPLNLITITLFGEPQSLAIFGSTTLAIRAPGAVYGALLIPLTFLLVSRLFREREAWWAAFLVTITPFAVQSSRVFYMDQSTVPLFYLVLGVVLFLDSKGLPSGRWWQLAIAYSCFALVLGDFFSGYGKVTAVLVIAVATALGVAKSNTTRFRRLLLYGVLPCAILGVFLVLLPFITQSVSGVSPGSVNYGNTVLQPQYNLLLNGQFGQAASNYANYFGVDFLIVHGDPNPAQNTGITGELLYPDLVFFYGGLVILLVGLIRGAPWGRLKTFLILGWLASGPAEVAVYSPTFYTDSSGSIFMMPALQIISAFGVCYFLDYVARWRTGSRSSNGGSQSKRIRSWSSRLRRSRKAPLAIVVVVYLISFGVFGAAYFGPAQYEKLDNTTGSLGWQWSLFYGFPQASQFIAQHDPTGQSVFISPNGMFGGSSSLFDYYYYQQSTPLNYLNYYSSGRITEDPVVNISQFYSNVPSWIISGSLNDTRILTGQGGLAHTGLTVTRPDGNVALVVITTRPGLAPWAASQINQTLFSQSTNSSSEINLTTPNTLDSVFTISVRFYVPYQLFSSNVFFNLIGLVGNGVNLAGLRLSSQSFQPGGGSELGLTLNSYVTNSTSTAIQLWSHESIAFNTTYEATLVYSHGLTSAYLNATPYVSASIPMYQAQVTALQLGSNLGVGLLPASVWPYNLTSSQIGYLHYR